MKVGPQRSVVAITLTAAAALPFVAVSGARAGGAMPFTEEAVARGVSYVTVQRTSLESFGYGIAVADLDGDHDLDLVTLGNAANTAGVFENDGAGVFTDRSATSGLPGLPGRSGVVAFDYDADGDLDLFFTQLTSSGGTALNPCILARNDGGFVFTDVSAAAGVDLDAGDSAGPSVGDFDGDGWLDVHVPNYDQPDYLFRNRGDGTFEEVAAAMGVADPWRGWQSVFFDMDLDGDQDLFVSNDKKVFNETEMHNRLYENAGGVFVDVSASSNADLNIYSMGVAVGDVDGNGLPDLYCSNLWPEPNAMLINHGAGIFEDVTVAAGVESLRTAWSSMFLDFDNSGTLDLYVCNVDGPIGGAPQNRLYLNGGSMPYIDRASLFGVDDAADSYGGAMGDVDGDGDLDLVVQCGDENIRLYMNHQGSQKNWIRFRVNGRSPNLHAIGARVDVRAGVLRQTHQIIAGGNNFRSQNELTVHAGLKDETVADEVTVTWPGGEQVVLTNLAANQVHVIDPPVVTPPAVTFTDVTGAAGLAYEHWTADENSSLHCSEAPNMAGGAAAADYDGDGDVDLFVTRYEAPNRLFRNEGDGTFTDVAASAGVDLNDLSSGCGWADVDDDGLLDLYVQTQEVVAGPARNYLYMNNGDGTFTEAAVARGADVGCANCRHIATSVAFGDYDLDGDLDFHSSDWWSIGALNRLLNNDGTGTFTDVTMAAGVEVPDPFNGFSNAFSDVDNDGYPDLLVAADFGTSKLFHNQGDGTFADVTDVPGTGVGTDENGMGATVADYDNDGDLDWFVTSIFDADSSCEGSLCNWGYTGNRLYRNGSTPGTVSFTDATDLSGTRDGGWGWGTSFFDFDNDGDLDLGMTNGVAFPCSGIDDKYAVDPVRLWENDGTGVMTEVSSETGFYDTGSGKGFVVFDYDGDGDQDVFIANTRAAPVLFRNDGGNANAWLRVNLCGTQTNRFGIGARVYVEAIDGGVEQMREVSANSNFMSQNEVTAHFGLGPGVTTIHRVRVEWPVSGIVDDFFDVSPNQLLTIVEGGGLCPGTVIPEDLNGDGSVGFADLNVLLAAWGPCPGCPADFNGDGTVGFLDLNLLLSAWGT